MDRVNHIGFRMPKIINVALHDDTHVSALLDFAEESGYYRDRRVGHLLLRIGKKRDRATWSYYSEHQRHGKRTHIQRVLGYYPEMKVFEARREAEKIAGQTATHGPVSKITFAAGSTTI